MPTHAVQDDAEEVRALLEEARARTEALIAPIADADYAASHHPVMGPVAWDVGHIAQQEDLWLVQTLGGRPETIPGTNDLYDAYRHPRGARAALPLLDRQGVSVYRDAVRAATIDVLRTRRDDTEDPLWRDLFVHRMIVLHEHQHDETILQHLAAYPQGRYRPLVRRGPPAQPGDPSLVERCAHVPEGPFPMGVGAHTPWTYDNEWPQQQVDVPAFWLQFTPVTNGAFLRFVEAGGYTEPSLWDPVGFRIIVEEEGATAPRGWERIGGAWWERSFDARRPLDPHRPVVHVSWYEADAFARWAGARLPTEAEWEKAATWDASTATKRLYPWGDATPTAAHANLDQMRFDTDPVGSHPDGATTHGIHGLIGDVWEWTSTVFDGYPGFQAFPYPDYSERFFDQGLRVLRGGSWATRPALRLGTFRNWDLPQRSQVFAGLRLAWDDADGRPPRLFRPM